MVTVVREVWGGDLEYGAPQRLFFDEFDQPVTDAEDIADWLAVGRHERAKAAAEFARAVKFAKKGILVSVEARRQIEVEKATGLFGGFSGVSMATRIEQGGNTPEPWLIDGLAKRRYDVELLAQEKAGKTVLVDNLARALVLSEPFLGVDRFTTRFPTDAAVGILDYELDASDTDEQVKRIFGDDLGGADRVFIENLRGTGFTLANEHHAAQVVKWCRDQNIRYLVIDVFSEAMRGFGSENFTDDAAAYVFALRRIAREADLLGTLTVHHASRESARDARTEGSAGALKGRGSQKVEASMDVILTYAVDSDGTRYLSAKGRGRVEVHEVAIGFDPDTERLIAEPSVVSAGVAGGEARVHTKALRVAPIIADADGSLSGVGTLRALLRTQGVTGNDGALNAVIDYAVRQGWIAKQERQGLPTVFRLAEPEDER